jgi:cyclopropane-fatty-acyl-phospholipid synthase
LDLICRKIGAKPGMRILEFGCGWGSFAQYAAEKYGAEVLGITVSKEQVKLARERCDGLPVEIRLQDYREVEGKFDAVISVGMFEHVGPKNYHTYMQAADRCLEDNGIVFLHTIGSNTSSTSGDPWTDKYIFPNGILPSIAQISRSIEPYFVMEDWHNFGPYYDKTLMCWHANFEKAWPQLKHNYDDRFYRMWRYYLLSSAGGFRSRNQQLWQIVMTRPGRSQPESRF